LKEILILPWKSSGGIRELLLKAFEMEQNWQEDQQALAGFRAGALSWAN